MRAALGVASNWLDFVNQAMTAKELEWLRSLAQRGQPFGNEKLADVDCKTHGIGVHSSRPWTTTEEQNVKIGLIPFFSFPIAKPCITEVRAAGCLLDG